MLVGISPFCAGAIGSSIDVSAPVEVPRDWVAVRYRCVLTGDNNGLDDVVLPISSFKIQRDSLQASVTATVNAAADYIKDIAARPNGELRIYEERIYSTGAVLPLLMISLPFTGLNTSGELFNLTAVLTANADNAVEIKKTLTAEGVSYIYNREGKRRFRAMIDPQLRPGDWVNFEDDGFFVGVIMIYVSTSSSMMEVAEVDNDG